MSNAIYSSKHQWYAAANIDIAQSDAEQALELGYVKLPAETRVDVLDLRCKQCQRWYDEVRSDPCSAATEGTAHLIGGPGPNVRRKRKCRLHDLPFGDCEHLHTEPTNYGRPPMPAAAKAYAA